MWIFNTNAWLLKSRAGELHFNISSSSPCGAGNCVSLQVLKGLQQCPVPKTSCPNSPNNATGIMTFKNILA